ncbi:MAG: N-acetyl-gamma-glutamyl-phosphate reductase [Actinomycetaceae bacterium]|nr:N-acetyl-gamma-glutamyl-phosphate reductase [Actinomycetaceae bacterium]
MALKVTIIGATGYAGGELCRILLHHPKIEFAHLMAKSSAGTYMREHHPHLFPLANVLIEPTDIGVAANSDIVFFALPHGQSGKMTAELRALGSDALAIDTAADHRLSDPKEWQHYYHSEPQEPWTYGLPELRGRDYVQREQLRDAREIAVPGCNVTAVTLGLQPAVFHRIVDTSRMVATLAVGYSGAGKALKPHLTAGVAIDNAQAYSVGGTHRHIPEILQNFRVAQPVDAPEPQITMTPVLIPAVRGILATLTAPLLDTSIDVHALWKDFYANEPLIDVMPQDTYPTFAQVRGSARAAIGVTIDKRSGQLVVISALDNLTKGTATQAVQSMNIALGLPEDTGLPITGVAP